MRKETRAPSGAPHPRHLVEADRSYIAPWGRRDILLSTLRVGVLAIAVAAAALAIGIDAVLLAEIPVALLLLVLVLFFRNPKRRVPREPGALVSPADGVVKDVEILEEGEYIGGPAMRVGIFLSILDVHVNRAPDDGEVEYLRYRPGKFHDARDERCIAENESHTIGIRLSDPEMWWYGIGDAPAGGADGVAPAPSGGAPASTSDERILVRQISGAIARRIVCPLVVGDAVSRGGLIGMIKYGSRTEIWVPWNREAPVWDVDVRPGDRVKAGKTIVFRRRRAAGAPHGA